MRCECDTLELQKMTSDDFRVALDRDFNKATRAREHRFGSGRAICIASSVGIQDRITVCQFAVRS